MNRQLSEHIIYHILANLGVVSADFINRDATMPIIDKQFLLPERLSFEVDGDTIRKNIYGCQVNVSDGKELKLLLADCAQDRELPEYCLLVQLKDAPAFGVYLIVTSLAKEPVDSEALIAVSSDGEHWMPCSTYLQATFLAGMEQLKDVGFGWSKATSYGKLHQQLLSFVKFHHNFYGAMDEGQEE